MYFFAGSSFGFGADPLLVDCEPFLSLEGVTLRGLPSWGSKAPTPGLFGAPGAGALFELGIETTWVLSGPRSSLRLGSNGARAWYIVVLPFRCVRDNRRRVVSAMSALLTVEMCRRQARAIDGTDS